MSSAPAARARLDPHDPAALDTLLSAEELAVRQDTFTEDALGSVAEVMSCAQFQALTGVERLDVRVVPGISLTVSFPALIRSGSSCPSTGYGPIPSIPFSDCSVTSIPAGT